MEPNQPAPPQARIVQLLEQFWLARAVSTAAELCVADALRDGPKIVAELATATETHEQALGRLMRALCSYGIFDASTDGKVALNPVSRVLLSDEPGSLRRIMTELIGREHWAAWGVLGQAVRNGRTAFDQHFGTDVWTYFRQHPEVGADFNQAMVDSTAMTNRAIMDAVDFRGFRHIVDVGGGHGSLLRLALEQNPTARGTLFDQPNVIEEAKPVVAKAGLAERCTLVGGDFFQSVPAGADAYLMKFILHDWDDQRCLTILRNVRQAIATRGTLLVFDTVIGLTPTNDMSTLMDLNMLAMTGGRERTEAELRGLFEQTGFALKRILPTQDLVRVTEAVAV